MGKTRKGKKDSKKPKTESSTVEEVSPERFVTAIKKAAKTGNVPTASIKTLNAILDSFIEHADARGPLTQLCIGEEVGSFAANAICDGIISSKYQKLQTVCFWRANIGDLGVSALGKLISTTATVNKLEMRDCGITHVGMESLSEGILANNRAFKSLHILRLDFNSIGDVGLLKLSKGLEYNRSLKKLSLSYCGIPDTPVTVQGLTAVLESAFMLQFGSVRVFLVCIPVACDV